MELFQVLLIVLIVVLTYHLCQSQKTKATHPVMKSAVVVPTPAVVPAGSVVSTPTTAPVVVPTPAVVPAGSTVAAPVAAPAVVAAPADHPAVAAATASGSPVSIASSPTEKFDYWKCCNTTPNGVTNCTPFNHKPLHAHCGTLSYVA